MRNPVVLRVLVPALVLLHFFLHSGLGLGRVAPDLLTLALLLAAREVGMGWGGGLGFAFGLLEDAFSVLAFGANTLTLTIVGILGARTRELFVGDSALFLFTYLFAGKMLREILHWVLVGEGLREPFVNSVLAWGSLGAVYVAVAGLLLSIPFGVAKSIR
jgi:rod shape-determining protein MreD